MFKKLIPIIYSTLLVLTSCANKGPKVTLLKAEAFAGKMQQLAHGELLDIRTKEEFNAGFIEGAKNMTWENGKIQGDLSSIDKETPLFVYCQSGARSSEAAAELRKEGFVTVYELENGMLGWNAADYPTVKPEPPKIERISLEAYNALLDKDKTVLVDFYADWCGPCKAIKPYIDELAQKYPDNLKVIRIDTDKNPEVSSALSITQLPTLKVYKKGKEMWHHVGALPKEQIEQALL